jgi:hypothetical protein
MQSPRHIAMSMLGLLLMSSPIAGLKAAELKVIAGGSLTGLFGELGPRFEQASGHKLVIHFDSTPNIITRVTSGTPFDLAVVPVDVFRSADAKARFAPAPSVDIARAGYGVIVRAGAPKPDISTPGALKKTLLDASSIAFVPASAAGSYVTKDPAAGGTEPDRPGRRQRRRRAWYIPHQRADRARCRTGRRVPRRIAAGTGLYGSDCRRYQRGRRGQRIDRLSENARRHRPH